MGKIEFWERRGGSKAEIRKEKMFHDHQLRKPIQKKLIFFQLKFFFLVFGHQNPWIQILIGLQPKMLDPDPYQMNTDPQPCTKQLKSKFF
jgi:hypothetical protein